MKIFKINEYVSHINESTINMDFGDVYAPKREVELVNFIHNAYHEFFNRKKEFGFDDIKQYKIDYSQIRDKSIVTKTLMQHEMLTLDDIEFLYILGLTKDEVENKVVSAYDAEVSDINDEHLYADVFMETCIGAEHFVGFLGDIEWAYDYERYGSNDYGDLIGVYYRLDRNNILKVDGDLLKKFPIYDARLPIEIMCFPDVYSSDHYGNDWLRNCFQLEMEKYVTEIRESSYDY
jgi:hypothetical protein